MESAIPKNALILFELLEVIKNVEIVAYKEKENKDILVRRIYKDKEIIMLGKVNKIIIIM
ncbi:MAG: hypothetical protein K0R72_950 [Clostridia bacterium]|jgi:hypothetical protein|nr:hypothetical protein [Clostridia bacterium]